jgi:hypothetical protein
MSPDVLTMAAAAASSPHAPRAAAAQHGRIHGRHSSTIQIKDGYHCMIKQANNTLQLLQLQAKACKIGQRTLHMHIHGLCQRPIHCQAYSAMQSLLRVHCCWSKPHQRHSDVCHSNACC